MRDIHSLSNFINIFSEEKMNNLPVEVLYRKYLRVYAWSFVLLYAHNLVPVEGSENVLQKGI